MIGTVSGAVAATVLIVTSKEQPQDDIISRLDAETKQKTSGEEWRRSGMIPK